MSADLDEAIALATGEEDPHEAAFGFAYIGKKRKQSFAAAIEKAREVGDSNGDYLLVAIASLRADAGDHDGAIATADLVREPDHVIGVLARLLPRTPAAKTDPLEERIAKGERKGREECSSRGSQRFVRAREFPCLEIDSPA